MGLKSWVALAALVVAGNAQVLNNQYLSGKYYFRHVSFATDTKGGLADGRTLAGSMTFDGAGGFTYSGSLTAGAIRGSRADFFPRDDPGRLLL